MSDLQKLRNDVWTILIDYGAHGSDRRAFEAFWPECREFRFQGDFGFGGKIWHDGRRTYVTYYAENRTDEREAKLREANARLATAGLQRTA